jgi:hypothetical protein
MKIGQSVYGGAKKEGDAGASGEAAETPKEAEYEEKENKK